MLSCVFQPEESLPKQEQNDPQRRRSLYANQSYTFQVKERKKKTNNKLIASNGAKRNKWKKEEKEKTI